MKLALLGHGRMGRCVAERATASGDEIGLVIDIDNAPTNAEELASRLRGHDAAVDFSTANAVLEHATACARAKVPLVLGTTGWQEDEAAVRRVVLEQGGALIYAANFSIGVQVFYRLVRHAAELFRHLPEYDAFLEEAHHAQKRDRPSGTALRLHDLLIGSLGRPVPVTSTRAGHIPGTHRVGFDSAADQILLEHSARSRDGFAVGALAAAHWIAGRSGPGVFAFEDVLDEILENTRAERRSAP